MRSKEKESYSARFCHLLQITWPVAIPCSHANETD